MQTVDNLLKRPILSKEAGIIYGGTRTQGSQKEKKEKKKKKLKLKIINLNPYPVHAKPWFGFLQTGSGSGFGP